MSENNTLMTDAATTTEGSASTTAADAAAPQGAADNAATQQTVNDAAAGNQDAKPDNAGDQNDASTTDDKSAAGEDEGKPQGAPESYEDFKIPEGVQVDAEVVDGIKDVAKKLNLTQEQAQELADFAATRSQTLAKAQADAIAQARTEWGESAKTDKEFGGDKLAENLGVAKKALDAFGTPELRDLLDKSGLGNHPEIIRAFYRAGKSISEDRFVPSGASVTGVKDPAKSLYPNQP